MQSQNRKMKRVIAGLQNPKANSTKVGNGKLVQEIILPKGANLPIKTWDKLTKGLKKNREEYLGAYSSAVRNANKVYTKVIVHDA